MPSIVDMLYGLESPKQKCIYCDKYSEHNGWESLCNRTCYYGLVDLLESYEKGAVSDPDARIVKYFTIYPEPSHTFFHEKISEYIAKSKLKED
jgi:hypothetical protein